MAILPEVIVNAACEPRLMQLEVGLESLMGSLEHWAERMQRIVGTLEGVGLRFNTAREPRRHGQRGVLRGQDPPWVVVLTAFAQRVDAPLLLPAAPAPVDPRMAWPRK